MMIRRILTVGGLAAVFMATAVAPALADDLADYFIDADEAIYSGTRIVGTTWDGIERIGIVEIQHVGGMTTVGSESNYATVGHGRMHLTDANTSALSYVGVPQRVLGARYVVSSGGTTEHLGRRAYVLQVTENDLLRMRMIVDESTSAPVATEVYSADGTVFRYSSMVEFSVSADPEMATTDEHTYEMMLPVELADFPVDAAGYQLVDAYAGPKDSHQAFYTDGLFSFSVFTTEGRVNWEAVIEDELPYAVDGHSYWRVIDPASVWVLWNAPGMTFALLGDLPPDHLEDVLADLPRPGTDGWMKRMWTRLFG